MKLWKQAPALYVALLILIGTLSNFFLPTLLLTLLFPKRLLWCIPPLFLLYMHILYPILPEEDKGRAHFHIEEVKRHAGPVKMSYVYRGTIKRFEGEKGTYYHLPVQIHLDQKRYPANCDYSIDSQLTKISFGHYTLKGKMWVPIEETHSFAEWRFQLKEKVRQAIQNRFPDKKVAKLLSALATGSLESRLLAYQFNALGLQHLLAISGFHFVLLTSFLAFFLKRFLPERLFALTLLLLLGTYFFYMGSAPSISRAWMGVTLYLIGMLFHYRTTALNALGIALLFALICDPLILFHIGFQLSFGATLGILLFCAPFEKKCLFLFPKRPYEILLRMSLIDQIGYLVAAYLRKAFALQGAVTVFTLPLILFHFGSCPLISFFYNLFYPLLFSFLLALFLLPLDFLTAPYASFLLTLVTGAPKRLLFLIGWTETSVLGTLLLLWLWRQRRIGRKKG